MERGKRKEDSNGLFIVIDGLDGIGKGEVEKAITGFEQKLGRNVFDVAAFSRAEMKGLPELDDFWNPPIRHYHTLITAEPTYAGVGKMIREEIIATKNKGRYSTETEIQMYSLDRLIQMQRVIIPALWHGLRIVQSRSMTATLTYQSLRAEEEGRNSEKTRISILKEEGNQLQLQHAPDLLIIPTIKDVDALIERLRQRAANAKDDKARFETVDFQRKLKPLYESDWLRNIFEERGTKVEYLDAGISEQETRKQAIGIYQDFLKLRGFL